MDDFSHETKKADVDHESVVGDIEDSKVAAEIERHINQPHAAIYAEAIARYPNDDAIDQGDEARLKRKLDKRILPLLGICYFFYVSIYLIYDGDIADQLIPVCRQDHIILRSNIWNQR